jgi:hypothetical protein
MRCEVLTTVGHDAVPFTSPPRKQKQLLPPKCGYLPIYQTMCCHIPEDKHFQVYIDLVYFIVHILFITMFVACTCNASLGVGLICQWFVLSVTLKQFLMGCVVIIWCDSDDKQLLDILLL